MEIQNVFTNKVVLLCSGIGLYPFFKIEVFSLAVVEEAGVIANGSI